MYSTNKLDYTACLIHHENQRPLHTLSPYLLNAQLCQSSQMDISDREMTINTFCDDLTPAITFYKYVCHSNTLTLAMRSACALTLSKSVSCDVFEVMRRAGSE